MNFSTEVPLPLIDDMDLFLEVHTHRDIRPPTAHNDIRLSDTERLADLGAKILDTVVTYHLFSKTPYISAQEIAVSLVAFGTQITLSLSTGIASKIHFSRYA